MCGICGIINVNKNNIIDNLYESIFHLQHRGQDSCGISTSDDKRLHTIKGQGLIRYIFKQENLNKLKGCIGIGHVRYPTTGNITDNEIQPFYLNRPYGLSICHNGNIYNYDEIKLYLEKQNIHINSTSDSELLLNLISYELETNLIKNKKISIQDNIIDVVTAAAEATVVGIV